MGRQCFDLMVYSSYDIPKDIAVPVIGNVVQSHNAFILQHVADYTGNVYSVPVMVKGPNAVHIAESMLLLVRLFDWNSSVTPGILSGKGPAAELAIAAYELCNDIINALEDAIYNINNGNISRENIKRSVQIYMRIS